MLEPNTEALQKSGKRLIPVTKWPQFHEWPSVYGLRHLIFWEKTNGFDRVVVRVGRRVLLDEEAFFNWVEEQRQSVN